MAAIAGVPPQVLSEVEDVVDSALVSAYNRHRRDRLNELWPKPSQGDIESLYHYLMPQFGLYRGRVLEQREMRYMHDKTPAKWQKYLQTDRRFHTRLSHNQIMRISGIISRTVPEISVPPTDEGPKAMARSEQQTRWTRQLIHTLGTQGTRPVFDQVIDNAVGDGLGACEVALREHNIYDDIDTDPELVPAENGGFRQETPKEMERRITRMLTGAALPFVVRKIDPMMLYFEEREDELARALIVEYKPMRLVYGDVRRAAIKRGLEPGSPDAGTPGFSLYDTAVKHSDNDDWYAQGLAGREEMAAEHTVLTIRYYDHRWYMYIVGGMMVDCYEHKMPGIPVFLCPGLVTGSDLLEERFQGATWGMTDIEMTLNDLLTLQVDSAYTYSRPRPYVAVPKGEWGGVENRPPTLRLDGGDAPRLFPGETIEDAFRGFENHTPQALVGQLMDVFQMSGLNPIAQGVSPGAGTAGYAINTQAAAAFSMYEPICRNYAHMLANICDFVRRAVRDTLGTKVCLAVPSGNGKTASWSWLDPKDVDDVPTRVEVDPVAESTRQAKIAAMSQLNKEGFAPRREVQIAAGAQDPDEWDDQIALDVADQQMLQADVQEAERRQAFKEQQETGNGPQNPGMPRAGQPGPQGAPPTLQSRLDALHASGGVAAPMNAPEVSPELAGASQGQSGIFQSHPGPAAVNSAQERAGTARP